MHSYGRVNRANAGGILALRTSTSSRDTEALKHIHRLGSVAVIKILYRGGRLGSPNPLGSVTSNARLLSETARWDPSNPFCRRAHVSVD